MGLGLHDDGDIPVAGLEAAREADRVFAEFYTSRLTGATREALEARLGRTVEVLSREDLEHDAEALLSVAASGRVVLLVAGDPMAATTHIDLRLRAVAMGIDTRVFHAGSILTAAFSELGLSVYKSGRTTTLQWPHGSYFPTSPYEVVVQNARSGLHSLVLLDIHGDEGRYMSANEGCDLLLRYEQDLGGGVTGPDGLACVVARAGAPGCVRRAGRLQDLAREDFGPPLHCIVVPGRLHFMEVRALVALAGAEEGLVGDGD